MSSPQQHPATAAAADSDADKSALRAAMAVFDRHLRLYAPHEHVVREALAAAGEVYATAEKQAVDDVLAQTGLFDMQVLPGGDVRVRLKHAAVLAAASVEAFDAMFEHAPAANYHQWEYSITDPATEKAIADGVPYDQVPPLRRYQFIVVKPDGKTPHQLRREAEQHAERLQAELDTAYERLAIEEFDGDSCPDLLTTVDYAVAQYRRVAEAEARAADQIRRLSGAGRPPVVVLCGSTRFYDAFQEANYRFTMAGEIVLSVGFYPHAVAEHGHGEGVGHDSEQKAALDELHKRKIDLADRVHVLNIDGYIGESTRSEIAYARAAGKPITYEVPVVDQPYGDALGKPATPGIRRPWTPDEKLPGGGTRVTVKRACNGCHTLIGDVTEEEMTRYVAGLPADDVTGECPVCSPSVPA